MVKHSYVCGLCGWSFPLKRKLTKHLSKHVDDKEAHQCFVCKENFPNAPDLINHSKTLIGGAPCYCCICGKRYAALSSLVYHGICHRNGKFRNQSHCKVHPSVSVKESLGKNMSKGTFLKRYTLCGLCGEAYGANSKHMQSHVGQDPASVCFVCGEKFAKPSELKHHSIQLIYKTPYSCCICGKKYTQIASLDYHGFLHRSNQLYKCHDCGEQFTNSTDFNDHVAIHKKKKPYKCFVCKKAYATSFHLNGHIQQKHPNWLPYSCSFCGSRFDREDLFDKHFLSHIQSVDAFQCSLCAGRFSSSDHLKKHMYVHRDEQHSTVCNTEEKSNNGTCKEIKKSTLKHRKSTHCRAEEKSKELSNLKHSLSFYDEDKKEDTSLYRSCSLCIQGFVSTERLEDHLNAHKYMVQLQIS